MSEIGDNLVSLLEPFGITVPEGEIYCLLAKNGQLSALEISRKLALPRTRVYRLLDKLLSKKLISMVLADNGSKYAANSYKDLEIIVADKEAEVTKLKNVLPLVYSKLGNLWAQEAYKSRVKYYSGREGLEQVTWNSLKAKGLLRTMEVEQDMTAFIDPAVAEKLRQEFVDKKIFVKQLTNKKHIKPYTKVSEMIKHYWEVRYLDSQKLPISFEMLIYNNVVAMYNFTRADEFCVEIYNRNFADLMTNIFDLIWSGSQKMNVLNDRGEAKLF